MKEENETYDIYYDELGDFLEVSFGIAPKTEFSEEIEPGVFVTRDEESKEVKSVGILSFKKRAKEAILKKVLKQIGMSILLDISIDKSYN